MSIAKFTQRITARSQDKYAQGTGDLERNGQVSSTRMPFLEGVSRQKPTAP
ncbi:hypothetical protein PENANT_c053G05282 [Penicillium antarcticum]|uniref:Uncharacterized protein n=1 Tax=Penicillium antarcticum TaxID=416450 RepID=A0A1V6PRM3_9EURO|nr:hypothetical protein PENANT_c053G05282 [Penicillium antarcticum]